MFTNRSTRSKAALLALLLSMVPVILAATPLVRPAGAASLLSVQRTSSGLVTSDPLTTGDTSLWTFGGVAVDTGAPHQSSEDSSGLHLGVQALIGGQYYGYFAARGENAQLFHARLSLPSATIPAAQNFNTGLYVQTGGSNVDYVTCAGGVNNQGYFWAVVQTIGNPNQATQFNTLWFQWMNNQPLTRDCTIITNGSNFLQVYLDGSLVYSSSSLNLGYQYPLTTFLEVESTDNTSMHFSTYTNYYATSSNLVTVTGALSGSTAELVDASGRVLASGQVDGSGTAHLDVGMYPMPINAKVEVFLLGLMVASTPSTVQVYGGDVYSVTTELGTTGNAPAGPYTSNPSLNGLINSNVGQGISVNLGPGGGSSPPLCVLGICP